MNKLFTKVAALTLGVAMAAGVGVALGSANVSEAKAAEETVSWTATAASNLGSAISAVDGTDVGTITTGSFTWDYTRTLVALASNKKDNISFQGNTWIQLGSNNAKESLVLTTDEIPGVIKEVNVVAAAAGGLHKITIDVGGTKYVDSGELVSYSGTASATNPDPANCKVESSGSSSGAITVTIANPSTTNKAFLIHSLEVVYDEGETPTTQYSVTDSVENGSVSPSTVSEDATLTATITPDTGYNVPETVSVTMGGIDATHTYQNGVVTVENVTGDIVISGSCVAMPSPEHAGTLEDPYTVEDAYRAIDKGTGLANVYVRGITAGIVTSWSSQFNNISFNISDDGLTTGKVLQAYRCVTSEAHTIASDSDVPNGATVVMYGTLKKYNSTYELDQGCYIAAYTAPVNPIIGLTPNSLEFIEGGEAKQVTVSYESFGAQPTITVEGTPAYVSCQVDGLTVTVTPTAIGNETVTIKGTNGTEVATADLTVSVSSSHGHVADDPYTVAEALAAPLSAEVYVAGKISAITEVSTSHGNATYNISDDGQDTNSMIIYRGKYINGADFTDASQIAVGGSVVVKGQLTQYQSKNQLAAGNQLVSYVAPAQSAWSDAQKEALETALHGYLPPFFGELIEDMTTTENSAVFTVSGDLSGEFAAKLGDGWELTSTNNYMKVGDDYYLTASIYTYGVRLDVGDYSEFTFTYHEGQPVQKYSVTYTAGQGTGDDYVVSDVEAGSSHALVTFETAEFTAPEGQQFKGWQVGNDAELRDAGYEITVDGDVTVTAIYEDIPATDWSDTFKTTFQSKFSSTVYPTFMVEFADDNNIHWDSSAAYCQMIASGNLLNYVATTLNADTNWSYIGQSMVYSGEYAFENTDQIDAYVYYASSQDVTVIVLTWVTAIKVDTTNAKTEYYVGDTLDLTNVYVHYELMDGDWFQGHVIDAQYWTASPTTLDEAGDEITINIDVSGMYQLSYTVKVNPVVMESISISGELSTTEYTEGDAWDATGLVATAHYNNGTEEDVTAQVSWTFQPEETVAGTNSVSVVASLGDISSDAANFDVVVNEPVYGADEFAKDLLDLVAPICANYDGKKNNKAALKTVWDTMSQRYSTLSNEEKAKVIAAAAKADGTDLEKAMAFYNYACKKYGLTKFIEGRQVKALVAEHETGNSILPIVVIVASSVAAITAIGVVIALKRRKALLAK